jgi:hypothetical protein
MPHAIITICKRISIREFFKLIVMFFSVVPICIVVLRENVEINVLKLINVFIPLQNKCMQHTLEKGGSSSIWQGL